MTLLNAFHGEDKLIWGLAQPLFAKLFGPLDSCFDGVYKSWPVTQNRIHDNRERKAIIWMIIFSRILFSTEVGQNVANSSLWSLWHKLFISSFVAGVVMTSQLFSFRADFQRRSDCRQPDDLTGLMWRGVCLSRDLHIFTFWRVISMSL